MDDCKSRARDQSPLIAMPNRDNRNMRSKTLPSIAICLIALISSISTCSVDARMADRSRMVQHRMNTEGHNEFRDNGRPIEGGSYRAMKKNDLVEEDLRRKGKVVPTVNRSSRKTETTGKVAGRLGTSPWESPDMGSTDGEYNLQDAENFRRKLSSQLTGCCYNYEAYYANDMCGGYGYDCENGEGGQDSHDSSDEDCSLDGLSFIGISFSVNTANGNPYSYQLCDQFAMENIIDRDYDYVMSMDEDGWLVGGGYKTFDYSGKMPYIDSSHTEILRIGSMDASRGGTTIDQVYNAMSAVSFPPIPIFPEYLKGGGGHNSGDDDGDGEVPSADITLVVSIVCTYTDDGNYCTYEQFLDDLFEAMYSVGGGSCMDDKDTDPHVSMSRGVKFKSSYHATQYLYNANLEVAVWQAMYPEGVVIGSSGSASFPPGRGGYKQKVGYGNLYFFFDRANITKAFSANAYPTDDELYYATLTKSDVSAYYTATTSISFDYGGSGDGDDSTWEHNPYGWKASMAMHDMTDGWDLPPNCNQEGETFFGIPLSRKSDSDLQSSSTFQEQFDFEVLIDRNYTYIKDFGTNHGWLVGESVDNGVGSIVDKDTAHIPLFYTGTTNPNMGGMSLSSMIKVAKNIDFGTLYIKPAFVFLDNEGHIKLQFEADANSALGYLYNTFCKELGISWDYVSPYNAQGLYTNCAMHHAGDRASYGCGPENTNSGGFCPQMTIAYAPKFQDEDSVATYLAECNTYVDYWRSLYPSGVAVGTSNFCPDGGCLALFLNRYDVYNVFKPDLGGSWVEYNGASMAPTYSPAPTFTGGCDEPMNFHLDKCFRKHSSPSPRAGVVAWDSLGSIGQFSVFLVAFMATTLSISIFLARARKRKRKNESYLAFFFRDLTRKRKRRKKKRLKSRNGDLEEHMLADDRDAGTRRSRSKSRSRSRSKSRQASRSRSSRGRSRSSRSMDKKSGVRSTAPPPSNTPSETRRRSRSRSRRQQDYGMDVEGSRNRMV